MALAFVSQLFVSGNQHYTTHLSACLIFLPYQPISFKFCGEVELNQVLRQVPKEVVEGPLLEAVSTQLYMWLHMGWLKVPYQTFC